MTTVTEFEGFVIAGAGIAGLATALALHRVGIKSVVLERAENLRSTGAALGVWTNAWKALEELGVAEYLRQRHLSCEGSELTSLASGVTRFFPLQTDINSRPYELRSVKRVVLVEALADSLPPNTIKFKCKVVGVRQSHSPKLSSEVELDDGTIIRAKGVIGCDGVNSVISQKFLGLPAANFSGRYGVRGMATYKEGHTLAPRLHMQFLKNVTFGRFPVNEKEQYWFIATSVTPPDYSHIAHDPVLILEWSEFLLRGFPEETLQVIKNTAFDSQSLSLAPMRFRWPWNFLSESSVCKGSVTVAGDAVHPMTPDLAQGGCSAIEDAIVLARCLAEAETQTYSNSSDTDEEGGRIVEEAFKKYVKQRKWRWAWLVSQAYVTGLFQQGSSAFFRFVREMVLKVRTAKDFYIHASYDCGKLPIRTPL